MKIDFIFIVTPEEISVVFIKPLSYFDDTHINTISSDQRHGFLKILT